MRWLLFLYRLAFICNIFFLLSASLQFYDWAKGSSVNSTIIIIGYFLAILLNPLVNLCSLILFMAGKKIVLSVPGWLLIANLVFLILQLLFVIYLTSSNTLP